MSAEILFVDDDPDILAGFQRSLRKDLKVDTAVGGAAGLAMMRGREPYAVVVADMQMPNMNGIEFLIEAEKMAPDSVRIMLTGNADQKTARDAVNHGHIFRFLTKPCPPEELIPALRAGLRQHQLITVERDVLEKTLNGSARMLSDILASHDPHSFGRSQRLREYMRAFARHLQLKQTWDLELAAMLSQVGYVTIPQALLERRRAGHALTGPEADIVARVPQIGSNLLANIPRLETVAAMILYQNKNFDGSGFPVDKIAGEDIPVGARILRVLQDLVAYESEQVSKGKVLLNMKQSSGQYDPRVLDAIAAVFDIYLDHSTPAPAAASRRAVGISDLRVGSTFASPASTKGGVLLVPAGTQVSPLLIEKLRNFASMGELAHPMYVTG